MKSWLLLCLVACSNSTKPQEPHIVWHRVSLSYEDSLPVVFQLGIQFPLKPASEVSVVNGAQKLSFEMTCEGDDCLIEFPIYTSSMELNFSSSKIATGIWNRDPIAGHPPMEFTTTLIDGAVPKFRFPAESAPAADFSGDWRLEFAGLAKGKAQFEQDDSGVIIGVITPENVGDLGYLVGRVSGNTAVLSTFDGQRAYRVELTLQPSTNRLSGTWLYPSDFSYNISGTKVSAAPPLAEFYAAEVHSEDGKISLPELDKFIGKPVIIDLFGSWCPSCAALVPVLIDIKTRHSEIEILSIAFEGTENYALAKKRLEAFNARYKPTWKSKMRLGEDLEALLPPELELSGFPITIFVNRDGTVHKLNTGFITPASQDHKILVAQFETWAQEIILSPSPTK